MTGPADVTPVTGPADVRLPAYGTPPPFLRHLLRDVRGVPVPYTTAWAPPGAAAPVPAYVVGAFPGHPHPVLADVSGTRQDGWVPHVTQVHPGRQRECVAKRLCGVCGNPIQLRTTAVLVGGTLVGDRAMFTRPPMHRRCARFLLRTWPNVVAPPALVVETTVWTWEPMSVVTDADGGTRNVLGFMDQAFGALKWLLAVPSEEAVAFEDPTAWAGRLP